LSESAKHGSDPSKDQRLSIPDPPSMTDMKPRASRSASYPGFPPAKHGSEGSDEIDIRITPSETVIRNSGDSAERKLL